MVLKVSVGKHWSSDLFELVSSQNTQLEFFTLIGVIFSALMQGYVCVNSIYVFLIQKLESCQPQLEDDPTQPNHNKIVSSDLDFELNPSTPQVAEATNRR